MGNAVARSEFSSNEIVPSVPSSRRGGVLSTRYHKKICTAVESLARAMLSSGGSGGSGGSSGSSSSSGGNSATAGTEKRFQEEGAFLFPFVVQHQTRELLFSTSRPLRLTSQTTPPATSSLSRRGSGVMKFTTALENSNQQRNSYSSDSEPPSSPVFGGSGNGGNGNGSGSGGRGEPITNDMAEVVARIASFHKAACDFAQKVQSDASSNSCVPIIHIKGTMHILSLFMLGSSGYLLGLYIQLRSESSVHDFDPSEANKSAPPHLEEVHRIIVDGLGLNPKKS